MKDRLFLLAAPFEDEGRTWYCHDCAALEGALLANPSWSSKVEVHRLGFARPRQMLVDVLGEDHQWMPALVMPAAGAPSDALRVRDLAILTDPKAIGRALVLRHGGAGPHP
jgi:hypothetical protein